MYRIVHTGANISLGGLKKGLLMVKYQSLTPSITNKLERLPMVKGIKIQRINFIGFTLLSWFKPTFFFIKL